MNSEENKISSFKKSIESTIKAISKKSNINVYFSNDKGTYDLDINLPTLSKDNFLEKKYYVRGISDSASLLKRFHSKEIHKELAPKNIASKDIFDQIEELRCELIGSQKYPGIKENLTKLENLQLNKNNGQDIQL